MFRSVPRMSMKGLAALAVLIGMLLLSFVSIQSSSASSPIKRGPGIMTSGYDLVGIEIFNGHRWICISPSARLDYSQGYKQISNLAHVSVMTSREIEYLLYTYMGTNSKYTAASLRIAVNDLVHHKDNLQALVKWRRQVPPSVYVRGTSNKPGGMLYEAAHLHGPYKLVNTLSSQPLPGLSATWTAQLVSATGYGVPHKTVNFYASGASVSKAHVVTNSSGVARVTLTRTNTSAGRAADSVHGLASNYMLLSLPRPYQQQLLSNSAGTYVVKGFGFGSSPTAPKTTANCPTNCTGLANVTVSDCLKTGIASATLNYVDLTDKSKVLASLRYGKSNQNVCHSATFQALNGHHILPVLTYTILGKNQPAIKYTVIVIDCPPFFGASVSQTVFCGGCQGISVQSGVNNATTTATLTYSDSAGNNATWQVAPGKSLSLQAFKVNAASVSYSLIETLPYATHKGARTQTAKGTVTIS